jgi:peptide/nickel transport system permease protein
MLLRAASVLLLMLVAASGMLLVTRLASGDAIADLIAPGVSQETIARERARLGRDQPFARQYATWLSRAVRFDFGSSLRYQRPVSALVLERGLNTALLVIAALVVASVVGLPLGVIAGGGRSPTLARLVRIASLMALSLPPLLMSLVLAWGAARTGWFPIGGMTSVGSADLPLFSRVRDVAWHLVLPTLALAVPVGARLERLQADAVASVRAEPFVVGALARGLPASRVIWHDVWRAALGPVLGVYGIAAGYLLGLSLAVELVTAWPGLGRLTFDALSSRDAPLAAGCAAAAALVLGAGTAISDLILAALDPRARAVVGEVSS